MSSRVLVLPSQTPGLIESLGITRAEADAEVWAVEVAGSKYRGAEAVNRVLRELGGFWSVVALGYHIPVLRYLENRGYRWIADHRSWLARTGVTPECEQPGIRCDKAN